MLCACVKLLMMMFGSACEHMAHLTTISLLVKDKMAIFEGMDRNHVAHLLWAMFVDACLCFSTPHDVMGKPPVSLLDRLIGAMKGGTLPLTLGTPLQSLFGRGSGNQIEGGQDRSQQEEEPGGPGIRKDRPTGPNINPHARIEAVATAARRCKPGANCCLVMATTPLPRPWITLLQLNRARCFNCLFFGECTNPQCSFKHDGKVDKSNVDGAIAKFVNSTEREPP
jgi:hypothetical protein